MKSIIQLIKKLFIVVAALGCAAGVDARQTVRLFFLDSVTVNDTVVRLGEIAKIQADSTPLAAELSRTIAGETAPPGYSRFINSNDLIMYRLKQQYHSFEFKTNADKRVQVRTAFVQKSLREYESDIKTYLAKHSAWKTGQCTVTIDNPNEGWKAYNAPLQVAVSGLEGSRPKGRVFLELAATQLGRTTRVPVRCNLTVSAPVVVAATDIGSRTLVDQGAVKLLECDITAISAPVFFESGEVVGKRAIGNISAGTVLTGRMLETPPLVQRGDPITIRATAGKIMVSVEAIARENGRLGEKIWVENSMTHKLVRVTINGPTTGNLM